MENLLPSHSSQVPSTRGLINEICTQHVRVANDANAAESLSGQISLSDVIQIHETRNIFFEMPTRR